MAITETKGSEGKPTTIFDRFPELKRIPKERFPRNVFIIPDGNGRWAQIHRLAAKAGHQKGAEVIEQAFGDFNDLRDYIPFVGVWGLSIDNLNRPKDEVDFLMNLFDRAVQKFEPQLMARNNRFVHIGNKDMLFSYPELNSTLIRAEEATRGNTGQVVYLAVGFSGADQNLRIAQKVAEMARDDPQLEINGDLIDSLRDGHGIPPADLIIRSSGEQRLSDVGWIQGKGTELFFDQKLFPTFTTGDFVRAIVDFSKRDRRLGLRPQS